MTPEEIVALVKSTIEEAAAYGKVIYINVNFNYSGSKSEVTQQGEPKGPPPPPGGGSGGGGG